MARIKDMSRGGWIIVGIVVTLLLVPTAAYGTVKALKFTGIEGTSGNKADVTAGGQLLTAPANPSDSIPQNLWSFVLSGSSSQYIDLGPPPSGDFPVITEIQIDTYADPSPGQQSYLFIDTLNNSFNYLGILANVNPPTVGNTVIPVSPPAPDGSESDPNQSGSAALSVAGDGISVSIIVSGYWAPCSEDSSVC